MDENCLHCLRKRIKELKNNIYVMEQLFNNKDEEYQKELIKLKKKNDNVCNTDLLEQFEIMDLQTKNNNLESNIYNQNTEIKKLKEEIEKFNTIIKHQQEQINSLVQDNNNLHTENCEMILTINDKDNEIEDLKTWVHNLKHNEETIKYRLTKEVNDLKRRVDEQITTIRSKDKEIAVLKVDVDNLKHDNSHYLTTNNKNVKEFTKIIELKDNEIEKLKESCKFFEDKANDLQKCLTTISHEDRRDYSGIFSRLKIIIQECESKVKQQAKIIKLKDNQIHDLRNHIDNLKHDNLNYRTRIHESECKEKEQYNTIHHLNVANCQLQETISLQEIKINSGYYDSKIKELDDIIKNLESKNEKLQKQNMCYQDECSNLANQFTETYTELEKLKFDNNKNNLHNKIDNLRDENHKLRQELMHERDYKEILIANIEKCFNGYTQQLNFLDLYRKNSLYFLEELNKFTTSLNIKVDIT